jgi:putative membrane protein insertion efficiency factor
MIQRLLKAPFYALLWLYQMFLSPFLGRSCRFLPTCSQYARLCLNQHSLPKALRLTAKRLIRCHPWGGEGYDPPPDCDKTSNRTKGKGHL